MRFKVIASGSKGNSTLIFTDKAKLIIDMGISYLAFKKELDKDSLSLDDFSGILITHAHKDHIGGLAHLLNHCNLNIFIPEKMYDSLKEYVPKNRCTFVEDNFTINDIEIELIHTSHDAPSSVGYIMKNNNKELVYVTDTGYLNRKYLAKMVNKDAYIIESNHDEAMLMDGPYPRFLKERVISDYGHLSNSTTAKYLEKIIGNKTKTIILAHLSETNNTPELALKTTKEVLNNDNLLIITAKQHEPLPIIEV